MPLRIIPREDWHAKAYTDIEYLNLPVTNVFSLITNTDQCYTIGQGRNAMTTLQKIHMYKTMRDIRYNFVVGSDGTVYEGRGWIIQPAILKRHKNIQHSTLMVAFFWRRLGMTLTIVPRSEWGALPPTKVVKVRMAVTYVFCQYTRTDPAFTKEEAFSILRAIQAKDFKRNRTDIRYSYVIGSDGTIYEGRGWGVLPYLKPSEVDEMTPFYHIGVMWNRELKAPPADMLRSQQNLIKEAVSQKLIIEDHELMVLYY